MTNFKISKSTVNMALKAMLGRLDLVDRWWSSPNINWNLQTPNEVWEQDPEQVVNYVMAHLQK